MHHSSSDRPCKGVLLNRWYFGPGWGKLRNRLINNVYTGMVSRAWVGCPPPCEYSSLYSGSDKICEYLPAWFERIYLFLLQYCVRGCVFCNQVQFYDNSNIHCLCIINKNSDELLDIRFNFLWEDRWGIRIIRIFYFATIDSFFPLMGVISFCGRAAMLEPFQCKLDIVGHAELDSAFDVITF